MPGAFKLGHLQPFEPILFYKLSICLTFILGGQFLLPQGANSEKREFIQLQNWRIQRGLSAWGFQTGPFAAFGVHIVLQIFHLYDFDTGRPFLITPKG